jgi:importin subunit alpha-1
LPFVAQAVIEAGVVRRLVELLGHPSPSVQTPALRTVGNIVTGDDLQTQIVINCGALPCLLRLLNSHKKSIRKEACWTISNITAGNKDQIQNVIDCGLVPPLIQLLAMADFDVRKEAAWAISNATSGGTPEQIRFLVQQQCIRPLCDLLTVQDPRIINVALEGIENILKLGEDDMDKSQTDVNDFSRLVEEADGMDKLETLQSHANDEIYQRAVKILETYFGLEEEEVASIQPDVAADGSAFNFGSQPPGEAFAGFDGHMLA